MSGSSAFVGTAIVGAGDDRGVPSLALWQTDRRGRPGGAWMVPTAEAFTDPATARSVLDRLHGRPITGTSVPLVRTLVGRLGPVAGHDLSVEDVRRRTFSVLDAVEDTVARRALVETAVDRVRSVRPSVTPVEWRRGGSLIAPPRTLDELRQVVGIAVSGASDVATELLGVAHCLAWVVDLWDEIAAAVRRRTYLVGEVGPVGDLPARWSAAHRAAAGARPTPPSRNCERTVP